ncbi:MAG TPA: metallophosphoesterase family protein [Flavobacteriaceae bacterium]|nr:metallophosphoesterase family protein [Flavobacteriaceae bacterium]
MRTLVIGDIHGGLKALQQVLQRAEVTPEDTLIFLGDYVDGWSDSYQTVCFLIQLNQTHRCIFLRGNHDDLCYGWLKNNLVSEEWLVHGGKSTIRSFEKAGIDGKKAILLFFENLKNYYIDSHNRLFVHAGFQSHHGPEKEHLTLSFYWDRTLWETAVALDKSLDKNHPHYPKRLLLFNEIFIGHTPVTRIGETTPTPMANVWNIDTGAAFKGPLTLMDVTTKTFWQSDEVWTMYLGEKGRNP